MVDQKMAIVADRARLAADVERHIAIASEHATENTRLRAALEHIIGIQGGEKAVEIHTRIAREALAGAGAADTYGAERE